MLRNEPLLFVQGPPVFIKVVVKDEESTSVFVGNEDDLEVVGEVAQESCKEDQDIQRCRKNHESQKWQIHQLSGISIILEHHLPDKSYRPLQFVLGEETLKGTIEKIDGETLVIEMTEGEKEVVSIEMATIKEILWRGDPFLVE